MNLVTLFDTKPAFADASPKDSLGDLQTLICDTQFLGIEVLVSSVSSQVHCHERYCS